MLLVAAILLGPASTVKAEPWEAAVKRGDFAAAATLLQRVVFEPPRGARPDAAALRQLALLYADGKGVDKDPVLACGLLRAHAVATAKAPRVTAAAKRAAQTVVDRYCSPLSVTERAAAFAAMSCPRVGLQRGATVALEPGWSIRFNDRSVTVTRNNDVREQPLAGDGLCRSQVLLMRHSSLDPSTGALVEPQTGTKARNARHVIELVTLHSAWHNGALARETIWQLYEVRGLALDLAAVERWQEPGSAWPAPELPGAIARGVTFAIPAPGQLEYAIPDDPPRRGAIAPQQARR
jgi:hypothetical protein